jgi:hypothetical protein
MELLLYLTLATLSNFSVTFQRGNASAEDYFSLNDNSTRVRLFRFNDTINMHLEYFDGYSLYQLNCSDDVLQFHWPYYINAQNMILQHGDSIDKLISVETESQPTKTEEFPDNNNIIYQCIMGVLLIILLVIESPGMLRRVVASMNRQEPSV